MISYKLIRSKRKSISLSVASDLQIIVRAPLKMNTCDIDNFINKHLSWIEKQKLLLKTMQDNRPILTDTDIENLKLKAKEYIPNRTLYFSKIMNVSPASIKITSAKKRLGSCSAKNAICFTYRLMLLDLNLIDYVIVHELAYIKEKNHGSNFYKIIFEYIPDYKAREQQIKQSYCPY